MGIVVALAAAVAPALEVGPGQLGSLQSGWTLGGVLFGTYNKPMLIAIVAPIFSFLLICWLSRYFQGKTASATSTAAEYAAARFRN